MCYLSPDAAKTAALEIGGAVSEIGIGMHDIVCKTKLKNKLDPGGKLCIPGTRKEGCSV